MSAKKQNNRNPHRIGNGFNGYYNGNCIGFNGNCNGPCGSLLAVCCLLLFGGMIKSLNPGIWPKTHFWTGLPWVCVTKQAQTPIKTSPICHSKYSTPIPKYIFYSLSFIS